MMHQFLIIFLMIFNEFTISFTRTIIPVKSTNPISKSLVSSLSGTFSGNKRNVHTIKEELLSLVYQSQRGTRGSKATNEEKARIAELFEELESASGLKQTLKMPELNAIWKLEYTTSPGLSGKTLFSRVGPVLQKVNANNLTAENQEVVNVWNFFKFGQRVTAKLIPQSPSQVEVRFQRFYVGPFTFPAPSFFRGTLNVTFVDDNLRLSRGNKGSLFVLTKYGELP